MASDDDRFATVPGGREVAYRVMSDHDGPLILHTSAGAWPADLLDDDAMYGRFLRTLGLFGRLVVYDRPGLGSSDPLDPDRGWFEQMTAARLAVMDAEQAEAAWIVGGTLAAMTETIRSRPERILGAVLLTPVPVGHWRQSTDFGIERRRTEVDDLASVIAPSREDDPLFIDWLRRAQRLGSSATNKAVSAEMNQQAVEGFAREAKPTDTETPVLLIRRRAALSDDLVAWWTGLLPGAEIVTVEGRDPHLPTAPDAGYIAELAGGFITGTVVQASTERVLRAVLFCDLVESTPTAAASGDEVWSATLDRYEALVERTAEARHGTIVKHTGDGSVITFRSGSDAIAAAIELRSRTRDVGLESRIGMHLGEIEQRGDDIGGIAVNLAARVMGEARPGEIVTTSSIEQTTIGGRFRFVDLGERSLKGIERPWRVFSVEPIDPAAASSPASATP